MAAPFENVGRAASPLMTRVEDCIHLRASVTDLLNRLRNRDIR